MEQKVEINSIEDCVEIFKQIFDYAFNERGSGPSMKEELDALIKEREKEAE